MSTTIDHRALRDALDIRHAASSGPGLPAAVRLRGALHWLAVPLLMLGASLLFRGIGFLATVIDTDEGLYLVQAQQWLRGGWPLVAVWDMHPIGAPALYAVAISLLGESVITIRVLGVVCVAATGWAVFGLVRAAGLLRPIAIAAGVLTIAHTVLLFGLATNTEVLFGPYVVGALALGVRAAARVRDGGGAPRWLEVGLAGLLFGLALAIKPVMVPEGCLAFGLLTFPAMWRRRLRPGRFLAMAAAYAGLCALPTALFGLVYAWRGEFAAFLDGSLLAPLRYSGDRLGANEAWHRVQTGALVLVWPFILSGLALARWGLRRGRAGWLARVTLVWFGAATVAVVGPGFFYPHYFLIWMPPLSVLAALGAWRLSRFARPRIARAVFVAIVALVAADAWQQESVVRLGRGIGLWNPDPVQGVANAIRAKLQPGETIFVANYHPVVYALTDSALPTRFIFPAHLTGAFTQVADIDTDAELRRVLATRPRYVVVDRGWWLQLRPSAAAILTEALARDYALEQTVAEERGPVELWVPRVP
jgi:hypothetical protein